MATLIPAWSVSQHHLLLCSLTICIPWNEKVSLPPLQLLPDTQCEYLSEIIRMSVPNYRLASAFRRYFLFLSAGNGVWLFKVLHSISSCFSWQCCQMEEKRNVFWSWPANKRLCVKTWTIFFQCFANRRQARWGIWNCLTSNSATKASASDNPSHI